MPPSDAAAPPASGGLRRRIDKVSEQLTIEDAFEAPLRQVVQDLRRLLREANDSKHVYEKTKLRRAAARPDGDSRSSASSGVQCDPKGAERAERDIYFYIGEAMESSSCQTEDVEIVTEHKDILSKKEQQEEKEVFEEIEVKEENELDHSLSDTATSIASEDGMSEYDHPEVKEVADSENEKNGLKDEEGKRGDEPKIEEVKDPNIDESHAARADNLPGDMSLDELKNTASDFGEVVDVKIWKGEDGGKSARIEFGKKVDIQKVLQELDRRRVEGWHKLLRAYLEKE